MRDLVPRYLHANQNIVYFRDLRKTFSLLDTPFLILPSCVLSIHHSLIVQGRLWKMYRNQLIRFYQIHFCLSRVFSSCNLNEV